MFAAVASNAQATHGSSDMPVCGPVFRGLGGTDTRSKIRVANLVQYLESLQEK
jgi:hypothetical protein